MIITISAQRTASTSDLEVDRSAMASDSSSQVACDTPESVQKYLTGKCKSPTARHHLSSVAQSIEELGQVPAISCDRRDTMRLHVGRRFWMSRRLPPPAQVPSSEEALAWAALSRAASAQFLVGGSRGSWSASVAVGAIIGTFLSMLAAQLNSQASLWDLIAPALATAVGMGLAVTFLMWVARGDLRLLHVTAPLWELRAAAYEQRAFEIVENARGEDAERRLGNGNSQHRSEAGVFLVGELLALATVLVRAWTVSRSERRRLPGNSTRAIASTTDGRV